MKKKKLAKKKVESVVKVADKKQKKPLTEKALEKKIATLTTSIQKSDETTSKLIKNIEKSFNKKLDKLKAEFECRLQEFTKAQEVTKTKKIQTRNNKGPSVNRKVNSDKTPPTISAIKGIGVVTERKLADVGIVSLTQLAEPSEEIKVKLAPFAKLRGFDTWQEQANNLLG